MKDIQAKRIRELRHAKGLSQKKLADALGISDRAVSKWEKGLSQPSARNLIAMAKLLNCSVDAFVGENVGGAESETEEKVAGMQSLTELYKIGRGPSSSHTIGPERAVMAFLKKNPAADSFRAVLYGSLAKTGKGHGTDEVIRKTFLPYPCEVVFDCVESNLPHPNTMILYAYREKQEIDRALVMSVGGGSIAFENTDYQVPPRPYALATFADISDYCRDNNLRLWQYVEAVEGEGIHAYMREVWDTMKKSIVRGLKDEGILPGGLDVQKKARALINSQHIDESAETRENRMVCAYAFAVSEQNAMGETIVTAPTCGASGVLPAVLYYQQQKNRVSDDRIIHALETAGLVGNLIKTNASISGAECGCQAEIGSACAMAAVALAELFELSIDKIEYAAEIAIEHHLGLTCDPICGLVQIPCIERNAVAAMRAINAVSLASFLWDSRKISFDKVVHTMKETGRDLSVSYKETSEAGLAKLKIK